MPIRRAAFAVLLAGPMSLAPAQDSSPRTPHEMRQLHGDAQAYIAMLEDPARDAYQKPNEVVAALGLKAGEVVADVGAGSGYFALRLASSVGPTGWVYAVDISPDMTVYMNRRIRDAGIRNLQTILAAPDDPLLRDASVDRFFICDTWHHIADQEAYLARMKRMLRPGGQVVMIDFHKRELPLGPPLSIKIAREDLIRQMEAAGFQLLREHTFLPYQYFLVFGLKPPGKG
ncbi:MAG TPA: methyltransferase domain-containing protein [Vicinamibacteria bacterium]|nr:methyltransferase domain-containing protein [Vicinamibacteria bacterium]